MKLTTREAILIVLLLFSLTLLVGYLRTPISTSGESEGNAIKSTKPKKPISSVDIEFLTNTYRKESGLNQLSHDENLCKYAITRTEEIRKNWSHDGYAKWVVNKTRADGYLYSGENLSKDYDDSENLVKGWINSPSHNENMLNPLYTSTCVRCSDNFCVQLFGAK